MKILVTGKNGQVGHALLTSLAGLGEVMALDRAQLDLADLDAVRHTVRSLAPDLIINAAAYTAVDQAETDSALAMRINGEAPGVLAEEAKKTGAALIHYSTDYVFDGSKAGAWTEDDVPAPLSMYGRSKLAGEQAIAATGAAHLILRTSWVYGLHGKNFLLTMLRLAQTRPELSIVDDQFGAPTWSRSIAEATAQIVRQRLRISEHSGVYHMSAGGRTSWYGFAQKIFAHPSNQHKPLLHAIPTADYPLPAKRPQNSALNSTKFQQTFCSLPQWDEALADCLQERVTVAASNLKAS
jgi:dTDP-4-dehydrorhamnose reductase